MKHEGPRPDARAAKPPADWLEPELAPALHVEPIGFLRSGKRTKFSLPHLDHPAVPKTWYLDELPEIPSDLDDYVLKPLFSFAGSGVKVDVTRADLDAIPADQRHQWVLQRKITYANAITMPEGHGVKAEVRVMLLRPPGAAELEPIIALVRLSRGKMLGVDFNKGLTWVGGSVGMWRR